ncbi:MAG: PSD1 and planctomycete cytochrome C domain-containing protein [Gemmataceae bacterium]
MALLADRSIRVCILGLLALAPFSAAPAAPPGDALAVLEAHCVKCHVGDKAKGGLDLATRDALLRGGDSGPAVVPGQPSESLLVKSIRHEAEPHMPHDGKKLPDAAAALVAEWVRGGAAYGRTLKAPAAFAITDAGRGHWAFQPVRRPAVPAVREPQATHNAIDRFLLAKLEAAGATFAPPASRPAFIRRVTLDLIGLPPTPAETDAFVADASPDAVERLVDRLLASPHYGERWGRHWLDLARYAETDGYEHDAVRPHSWRYRDYVVAAFNADKPFDRFVREQVAGDELWPGDPAALTATGFNLLGPDMVDSSDQLQRRHNTLNDMTDTAGLAFLGLTVGCARCHDHKFEPIGQRDYYGLQAFFAPARYDRAKPIPTPAVRAAHDAALAEYERHPAVRALAEIETPARDGVFQRKVAKLAPEAQVAHRTPAEKRNAEQANLVLETLDKVSVTEKEIAAAIPAADKERWTALREQVRAVPKPAALPMAMAMADGPPAKTFVLHRGEYAQPGDEVSPASPTVLGGPRPAGPSRAALADWLASPANPLTARVMVNRIWRHHFGRGLVATPSDFGTRGAKPTHPELLDWLAAEFVARGWSVKAMHRLMLTSAAYRQSSVRSTQYTVPGGALVGSPNRVPGTVYSTDPDNALYGRMNRLRLEGEVLRDSLLAVGGRLDRRMGGPGVLPPIPKELFAGATGWKPSGGAGDDARRSVYIFARRNLRFPFLEVFDAPDSNLSCPARERSTTAPQSLTLLNADEVTAAAQALAERLTRDAATADERVTLAFRLALGRTPTDNETGIAREFLARSPLSELCRALFNLNDFVYAE